MAVITLTPTEIEERFKKFYRERPFLSRLTAEKLFFDKIQATRDEMWAYRQYITKKLPPIPVKSIQEVISKLPKLKLPAIKEIETPLPKLGVGVDYRKMKSIQEVV